MMDLFLTLYIVGKSDKECYTFSIEVRKTGDRFYDRHITI